MPDAPTGGHELSATIALTRVDLGTLGGRSSFAADINDRNVVVGSSQTSSGATHAFRWSAVDGMIDLGTLPGDAESQAVAILDGGLQDGSQILGFSGSEGHWTPVVWSASTTSQALPIPLLPNASFGRLTGFNALGQVVGWDVSVLQHAWVWSPTKGKYDLTANAPGGSNEGAAAAIMTSGSVLLTTSGTTCHTIPECWRTYLWSDGGGYLALGTPNDDPETAVTGLGLNESGTIVGWVAGAHAGTTAYRWDAGTGFTLLSHYSESGYHTGYATAVNAAGMVVGSEWQPSVSAFVASGWPSSGGIVRLSPEDPNPSIAVAINASGTIAGWAAVSEDANHAIIWSPRSDVLANNRVMTAPIRASASAATTRCLADMSAITTRQKLTACAIDAAR